MKFVLVKSRRKRENGDAVGAERVSTEANAVGVTIEPP